MGESADRTRTDAKKWSRPMGPGAGGTTWRATSSLFTRLPIGPDGRRRGATAAAPPPGSDAPREAFPPRRLAVEGPRRWTSFLFCDGTTASFFTRDCVDSPAAGADVRTASAGYWMRSKCAEAIGMSFEINTLPWWCSLSTSPGRRHQGGDREAVRDVSEVEGAGGTRSRDFRRGGPEGLEAPDGDGLNRSAALRPPERGRRLRPVGVQPWLSGRRRGRCASGQRHADEGWPRLRLARIGRWRPWWRHHIVQSTRI